MDISSAPIPLNQSLPRPHRQHDPPDSIPVTVPIAFRNTPVFDYQLHMLSPYREDPISKEIYISTYFKSCNIELSTREIILINRYATNSVFLIFEIPLADWDQGLGNTLLSQGIPWHYDPSFYQLPPLSSLDLTRSSLKSPGVFEAPLGFYFGRVRDFTKIPVFRPTPISLATHLLIKINWHVPSTEINPFTSQTISASAYLERIDQLSNKLTNTSYLNFPCKRLLRATSNFYPQGIDYLLLPLPD